MGEAREETPRHRHHGIEPQRNTMAAGGLLLAAASFLSADDEFAPPYMRMNTPKDFEDNLKALQKDKAQYELWTYAQHYEASGEGAGLQAVTSAAQALLADETTINWVHARAKGARLRAYPRLAEAARDVIASSTARNPGPAADAHVLLYFLHRDGELKQQMHHISEATRLRPTHSRQWMILSTTHIAGGDWRAGLEATQKSVLYATGDYEIWGMQMSLGKCMLNVEERRREARAILEPIVDSAYNDETLRSLLTDRDLKDAVAANFMLVQLAFEDGDLKDANAHHALATQRFAALPAKLHETIVSWKNLADKIIQGVKSGAVRVPAKRRQRKPPPTRQPDPTYARRPEKRSSTSWLAVALSLLIGLGLIGLLGARRYLAASAEDAPTTNARRKNKRAWRQRSRAAAAGYAEVPEYEQEQQAARDAQAAQLAQVQAEAARAQAEALRAQADARRAVLAAASMEEDAAARDARLKRAVEEEVRREAADASCCDVCFDAPKSHVLQPCGHYCICRDCLELLTERAWAANTERLCPVCREPFHSAQRVYDTGR